MCTKRDGERARCLSYSTLFIARPRYAGHPSYGFVCQGTHTGNGDIVRMQNRHERPKYYHEIHSKMTIQNDQQSDMHKFVWKNYAPPRVRFFGWLLIQGRIQSRDNLLLKNIVESSQCEICTGEGKTADHIISRCPPRNRILEKHWWRSNPYRARC